MWIQTKHARNISFCREAFAENTSNSLPLNSKRKVVQYCHKDANEFIVRTSDRWYSFYYIGELSS